MRLARRAQTSLGGFLLFLREIGARELEPPNAAGNPARTELPSSGKGSVEPEAKAKAAGDESTCLGVFVADGGTSIGIEEPNRVKNPFRFGGGLLPTDDSRLKVPRNSCMLTPILGTEQRRSVSLVSLLLKVGLVAEVPPPPDDIELEESRPSLRSLQTSFIFLCFLGLFSFVDEIIMRSENGRGLDKEEEVDEEDFGEDESPLLFPFGLRFVQRVLSVSPSEASSVDDDDSILRVSTQRDQLTGLRFFFKPTCLVCVASAVSFYNLSVVLN